MHHSMDAARNDLLADAAFSCDQDAENTRVDFVDRIWRVFTSLKLAIVLLLMLSVLSVIGTMNIPSLLIKKFIKFS